MDVNTYPCWERMIILPAVYPHHLPSSLVMSTCGISESECRPTLCSWADGQDGQGS